MGEYNYKKLQNGSDIRGIATEGVPGEAMNLRKEETLRIARAFVLWLSGKTHKDYDKLKVAVGRDSRITGPALSETFCQTMSMLGVKVTDAGLASTPAMFMSTRFPEYDSDGAVMITASHLPYNRNGFKFFTKDGGLDKKDISDIITYAESDVVMCMTPGKFSGVIAPEAADLMSTYSAHLRNLIAEGVGCGDISQGAKPLCGMKIVVDAGNGAGGFFVKDVLIPLGADTTGSQFLDPDGTFPNHIPNPENNVAMESVCNAVKENHADLGLIFDTDVDRSSAVDSCGNEICRNGIVAMAAALIADSHPGTTVVTDSITSDQLTVFLTKKLGLKHLRYKRGYRNVINKAIELNDEGVDAQLAIETSGHAAYMENYFLDDGAYLAAKIVVKATLLFREGKKIESLIKELAVPAEAVEVRLPVLDKDFGACGDSVLAGLEKWAEDNAASLGITIVSPNYEGIRLAFKNPLVSGWCLLRKSLHDPIMPLNIETDNVGGCSIIAGYLAEFLKTCSNIDGSSAEKLQS